MTGPPTFAEDAWPGAGGLVKPDGLDAAFEALLRHRSLVLTAPAHGGSGAAIRHLVRRLRAIDRGQDEPPTVEMVFPDYLDLFTESGPARILVANVMGADQDEIAAIHAELIRRATSGDKDFFVVAVESTHHQWFAQSLGDRVHRLSRPDPLTRTTKRLLAAYESGVTDIRASVETPRLGQREPDDQLDQREAAALSRAAVDPRLGRGTRRLLETWASAEVDATRRQVVARVCGGEFGAAYPRIAVRWLAAIDEPATTTAVREAVAAMAVSIGPSRLLGLLSDWVEADTPTRTATVIPCVRAMIADADGGPWLASAGRALESGRSVVDSDDGAALVRFWSRILDRWPDEAVREVLVPWLDTATTTGDRDRTVLMEVLATAAIGAPRRFAALRTGVIRWPAHRRVHFAWVRSSADPAGSSAYGRLEITGSDPDVPVLPFRDHLLTRLDAIDPAGGAGPNGGAGRDVMKCPVTRDVVHNSMEVTDGGDTEAAS